MTALALAAAAALIGAEPAMPALPVSAESAAPPAPAAGDPPTDPLAEPLVDPAAEPPSAAPETVVPAPAEADITVHHHAPGDPLEGLNRTSYAFSTAVDKAVIRPAAMAYRTVVPKPARDGIRNALSNIDEPLVFINDLLQLKFGLALRTLGRFLINSTLGIGGLFDVAKREPFHLVHHANGLGDTLGYYGVGPGPYLYLPILGPSTLRDILGGSAESLVPGRVIGGPFNRTDYQLSTTIVGGLEQRVEADGDLKALLDDAVDPYATLRSTYLQDRAGEIAALKGKSAIDQPGSALDDSLNDPAAQPPAPPPRTKP